MQLKRKKKSWRGEGFELSTLDVILSVKLPFSCYAYIIPFSNICFHLEIVTVNDCHADLSLTIWKLKTFVSPYSQEIKPYFENDAEQINNVLMCLQSVAFFLSLVDELIICLMWMQLPSCREENPFNTWIYDGIQTRAIYIWCISLCPFNRTFWGEFYPSS